MTITMCMSFAMPSPSASTMRLARTGTVCGHECSVMRVREVARKVRRPLHGGALSYVGCLARLQLHVAVCLGASLTAMESLRPLCVATKKEVRGFLK